MALVGYQALTHFRHVPFFVLLAGYWVTPHLQSAVDRLTSQAKSVKGSVVFQRVATLGLCLAIALIGFRLYERLSDLRVRKHEFPVAAVQYMHENEIRGRLVVTYNWAQYAIAALCVDSENPTKRPTRVAFDGRFRTAYPQTIVDMHFDFLYGNRPIPRSRSPESPAIDPGRVLREGSPEIVLLARYGEFTEEHMSDYRDRWTLLYQDSIAQVWGLKNRFDDPDSQDYLPPDEREIGESLQIGSVTWPALPTGSDNQNETKHEMNRVRFDTRSTN